MDPEAPHALREFAEALKLCFADRMGCGDRGQGPEHARGTG